MANVSVNSNSIKGRIILYKREDGFTLIEMLIVLMIITVLILLLLPNITKQSSDIHEKGCDALAATVQTQVSAYQLEKGSFPESLDKLEDEGFITEKQKTCKNGTLSYNATTGKVTASQ